MTRPYTVETSVESQLDIDSAYSRIRAAIYDNGYLVDDPNDAADGSMWGVVKSGLLNMVPALVRAHVISNDSDGCRVHIRATGREGLIKQGVAAKAAARLVRSVASDD